jgi:hypothetical protein
MGLSLVRLSRSKKSGKRGNGGRSRPKPAEFFAYLILYRL